MIKYLLTICSILLLISSCKKDDDENIDPLEKRKEDLAGSYLLVSAIAKAGPFEQDITNNTDFIPACTKDDVLTLRTDLTFSSTDAGIKCNPEGSYAGTWSLPHKDTLIIVNRTFTILDFDGTNLKLGYKANVPPIGPVDVTTTFRKQ